jgi:hypothetical protein
MTPPKEMTGAKPFQTAQENPRAAGEGSCGGERRVAVFALITINVERLSGSNLALRRLLIKPRPG